MPRDYRRSYSRSPPPPRSRSRERFSSRYDDRDRGRYVERGRNSPHDGYNGYGSSRSKYKAGPPSRDGYRDRREANGGGERGGERVAQRRNSQECEIDQCRIHVADLSDSTSTQEIQDEFSRIGPIKEVWMAKNPPCFAFVVYESKGHAAEAVEKMDQKVIGNSRVRVTFARPRTRGRNKPWDPSMRCYQCGRKGHFSRDCPGGGSGAGDRGRSRTRSRSRGRYRSRSNARYSRSRSPIKQY